MHSTAYDVENWHGMERYEFDAKGEPPHDFFCNGCDHIDSS